jgi:hypothetical protein
MATDAGEWHGAAAWTTVSGRLLALNLLLSFGHRALSSCSRYMYVASYRLLLQLCICNSLLHAAVLPLTNYCSTK